MINLLIDDLDQAVKQHISADFNTNFRNTILFEILMQDNTISEELKINQVLNLYYPDLKQVKDIQKILVGI